MDIQNWKTNRTHSTILYERNLCVQCTNLCLDINVVFSMGSAYRLNLSSFFLVRFLSSIRCFYWDTLVVNRIRLLFAHIHLTHWTAHTLRTKRYIKSILSFFESIITPHPHSNTLILYNSVDSSKSKFFNRNQNHKNMENI